MVDWFRKNRGLTSGRIPIDGSDGVPASVVSANSAPFDFSGPADEVLSFDADGESYQVSFPDSAFVDPSAATMDEVVARLNSEAGDVILSYPTFGGNVGMATDSTGSSSSIQITGGTANSILDFDTDEHVGGDDAYEFVLGEVSGEELAVLAPGDYTEIKQDVDLTGVDLIGAQFDTIGVANGLAEGRHGLVEDANTLLLYKMDNDVRDAASYLTTAANLTGEGEIQAADEDYAPVGYRTKCREFPAILPVGTSTARLTGVNNPRFSGDATFPEYTMSFWLNFDEFGNYSNSTGIDALLFNAGNPVDGGLKLLLSGRSGASSLVWFFEMHHFFSGIDHDTVTDYLVFPAVGWKFFTIVYDSALSGSNKLKLYINGIFLSNFFFSINAPDNALINADMVLGSPEIFGKFDQFKFSKDAKDASGVLAEYNACVNAPATLETKWEMKIFIGGTEYLSREIGEDEIRAMGDFRAPVKHLSGVHEVAFRLSLAEV